jgi:putative flippase GtrA
VISSAIYAAVYLPLADFVVGAKLAVLAVPPAFVISATCGFFMHSKWSFKDHGTRDSSGRQHLKFFAVQGFGMALNLVFTWIITGPLFHGATWLPLVPSIFLTPLATFSLNRQLVFK